MLHRSFKPAKCKTSLKLAVSRLKLVKNKKDAQIKQLRGELAKLLEAGQDQTARIRVEHVVREEKTKEAYELIEIFCELIVARLSMVESQKSCPIDLKEAVSSVIFASPRCTDIPELMDIRKHLTSKYGKEFISAAIELRPECGVNRMLVEKLSAKAPDGQTKIKILTAIAEEYNIKWEPKAFGENDPKLPDDLLNGPSASQKANTIQMEPIEVQAPLDRGDKRLYNDQAPPTDEKRDTSVNFPQHSSRSTSHSQNSTSTGVGPNQAPSPGPYNPPTSGTGLERLGYEPSYGDETTTSLGRQHWSMKFKDATSAAQAAAESAERASLAARAAAELSSQGNITRQFSSNSQESSAYNLRNERPQEYSDPNIQGGHLPKDPVSYTSHEGQRIYTDDHKSTEYSSQSSLSKFSTTHTDDPVEHSFYTEDKYSQNVPKDTLSNSSNRSSWTGDDQIESDTKRFDGDDHRDAEKSSQTSSSNYTTTTHIDDNPWASSLYMEDKNSQENLSENETGDLLGSTSLKKQSSKPDLGEHSGPFVTDGRNTDGNTFETVSYENSGAVFDDYGTEDDYDLWSNNQTQESSLNLSLHGTKSPANLSETSNAWTSRKNIDDSKDKSISGSYFSEERNSALLFSESMSTSAVGFQSDDVPTNFDHSDGEGELEKIEFVSGKSNAMGLDDLQGEERCQKKQQHTEILKDTEILKEYSSESGKELNFENLRGGLRQKGYRYPPKAVNPSESTSSSKNQKDENPDSNNEQSTSISSSTVRTSLNSSAHSQEPYSRKVSSNLSGKIISRSQISSFDSDPDDLDDEFSDHSFRNNQEPFKDVGIEVNEKSSSRVPFDQFNNKDSEEDVPKQTITSGPRRGTGFSRRTKTSSLNYRNSNMEQSKATSETSKIADYGLERKSQSSHLESESPLKTLSQMNRLQSSEHPPSIKHEDSKSIPESKRSFRKETLKFSTREELSSSRPKIVNISADQTASKPIPESKRSVPEEKLKSSAKEQPSNSLPKITKLESLKSSSGETPRASHVHPKLPDYDDFAAHFHSLRQKR